MNIITLRTKAEVILIALFIIGVGVISVASVQRTITDTSDNSITFIRNTNGNYWETTGANLQTAINDLSGSNGGSVWVGDSISISATIAMKSNVQVDFQNNRVTLTANVPFVNFTDCQWAAVRNAYVVPSTTHTTDIIRFYVAPGAVWNDFARHNIVENVRIVESSPYTAQHNWTGIRLRMDGDSDISLNTFRDISIYGCRNGIVLESNHAGAYANGNNFEDNWIDRYINGIWFDDPYGDSFNDNVFNNVKFQTVGTTLDPNSGYTEPCYGVRDISGGSNRFKDCLVWDWTSADDPQYTWWIGQDAENTYIEEHSTYKFDYGYILDEGSSTYLELGGFVRPQLYLETSPPSNFEDGQVFVWIDTDNNNATYLCFFWNGVRKMVQLN
jgi:Tfp pilus assembly protein PilV